MPYTRVRAARKSTEKGTVASMVVQDVQALLYYCSKVLKLRPERTFPPSKRPWRTSYIMTSHVICVIATTGTASGGACTTTCS
jgi:hypothetical protein